MSLRTTARLSPALRRCIAWCLLWALPACGLSACLFELLGPRHLHREVVAASAAVTNPHGWRDARRGDTLRDGPRAEPSEEAHPHPHVYLRAHALGHGHGRLERHRHDPDDPSVASWESAGGQFAGAELLEGLSAVFGALVFACAAGLSWRRPPAGAPGWPVAAPVFFASFHGPRLERPPSA